jgi:hypothetical protein
MSAKYTKSLVPMVSEVSVEFGFSRGLIHSTEHALLFFFIGHSQRQESSLIPRGYL